MFNSKVASFICILIFQLFLIGCNVSIDEVKEKKWKYQDGYHIGDIIDFSHSNKFRLEQNGELYVFNEFTAKLIDKNTRKIRIESKSKEIGIYCFFDD